ncbi:spore germination protein [Alicyclobacillus sp. ALC3]|uniref:spore germination protein n=1 Tax=Alicyclobacillus sp. ALC3 TaxID=2796143 RepID=UPI0023797BE5|nr:spore germination protein [Alicyclobacillus sp. ALC3]WDL96056.1 spore germination protein [Alicyclobacillus sp. ALC3]
MKKLTPRVLPKRNELHRSSVSNEGLVHGDIDEDTQVLEQKLRAELQNSSDVCFRRFGVERGRTLLIVYIDGLVDTELLDKTLLMPLSMRWMNHPDAHIDKTLVDVVTEKIVPIARIKNVTTVRDIVDGLLEASVAVIAHGTKAALLAELKNWPERAIQESVSEPSIRGPREAFNESLRTSIAMVRKRIKSTNLKVESVSIGQVSQTDVALVYLEGTVNPTVLEELRSRLSRIRLDAVLETQYIEEFIEDSPNSPYPQVQNTERPDVVVAALLEGKIAILVDGTPNVLIVPMTFWTGFQAPDDYYERPIYMTAVRWVRFVMLNISIFLTPLYVALTSYHPQMLPTNLLITFAAARSGSPFPVAIEAFAMEFVFEGLREAGVRLPKAVGSAVSIVGGLVVGQAAVEAGLVSAPTVIMVATSGIASFTIPRYNFGFSYRLLRFFVLLLSAVVGLYGLTISFIVILIHQVNLESFGVPYMSPIAPRNLKQLRDILTRVSRKGLSDRPQSHVDQQNSGRQHSSRLSRS